MELAEMKKGRLADLIKKHANGSDVLRRGTCNIQGVSEGIVNILGGGNMV
jgi:hypothetical protein